jgi:hypothetical protein
MIAPLAENGGRATRTGNNGRSSGNRVVRIALVLVILGFVLNDAQAGGLQKFSPLRPVALQKLEQSRSASLPAHDLRLPAKTTQSRRITESQRFASHCRATLFVGSGQTYRFPEACGTLALTA